MPDTPEFLIERLKIEGKKMVEFFETLTDEQWQHTVYTEGGEWTIRSVLSHFVSAERAFLLLFNNILNGGAGASEDFSIDRYNASQQEKSKDLSPQELMSQYKAVRAELIAWVSQRNDDELKRRGRHAFLGETSLAEMVKMVYRHNQIHYRDLRKAISAEE